VTKPTTYPSPTVPEGHRPQVVVIYHFFPHYRAAVVEALARSQVADFTFVGDVKEYLGSVEPAFFSPRVRFYKAAARHVFATWMWQWGAIMWALDRRFDTVIFHAVPHWPCTWIGAALARIVGKRVIFWGHGYLYPPTGIKGLLRRAFYALPHVHLTYGRLAKWIAVDAGWRPEDLHVVYNSLDNELQKKIRRQISDEDRLRLRAELFGNPLTPVIACPSRLIAVRGLTMLLDAIALLREQGLEANLLLIGDGPERQLLEAKAHQLNVRVHFEGACYDEYRIGRLLMTANVTVAPGMVGLTAIHSMTYGVPVVTHDSAKQQMPEWETIVPNITGALFRMGSVNSLAEVMVPWLQGVFPTSETRQACHRMVDRIWNPMHQRIIIERAVLGLPASDIPTDLPSPLND
jgi:glycosyltransferase involved in cell wall biosynthesis